MTLHAYQGGSWKGSAPYAYNAGTWKLATSVSAYESGTWKTVAQILSAVAVTGSTAVSNGSPANLGTSVTGGYGPLTYLWTKLSGAGTISGAGTSSTVTINPTSTDAEGNFRVVVTDSLTGTTAQTDFAVTWGTPP